MQQINKYIPFLLLLVLLITAATFWPALTGPFLLDDLVHFPKLGLHGSVDSLTKVYQLVFSGSGTGSGRPISYLSLLINDNTWPTYPWSFKYTNLMFHLLNGVLVFIFCRMLLRLFYQHRDAQKKATIDITSLLVMAIWLIHPIQLSPMMLTIQRMTLLMGTFSLLALIFYLKGRRISVEKPIKGYWIMSLALAVFVPMGILCKETAVMTVCYIIAMEMTLFASIQLKKPPYWRYWYAIFILLPLGLLIAYLLYTFPQMQQSYAKREFNMEERLLSESRVLIEYLRIIFFPSLSATGPYHDDFPISRGLFSPVTTIFSILLIIGLLLYSIIYRRKHPLASFAILWFLLAHTLESTIIPLELYFEHRNYLPMLGFFISFTSWAKSSPIKIRKFTYVALIIFIVLETGVSFSSAKVWGNSALIANIWAYDHPASARAQLAAIHYWLGQSNIKNVKKYFKTAMKYHPHDAALPLYQFLIDSCSSPSAEKIGGSMDTLRKKIPTGRFEYSSIESIRLLVKETNNGKCHTTNAEFLEIIDLYLANPVFRENDTVRSILFNTKAKVYIRMGDLNNSIKALDKAYEAVPHYEIPLDQAYILATAGLFDDAFRYINIAKKTKPQNLGARLWQYKVISNYEKSIKLMQKDWKKIHPP
jgi:hypothetical protein